MFFSAGAAAWSVQGGTLPQASNISDGDGTRLPKLGTVAIVVPSLADQELRVRAQSGDDDVVGGSRASPWRRCRRTIRARGS